MIIYGTAILAICYLIGSFLGDLLGAAIGVSANVGGVGIGMLLLILARYFLQKKNLLPAATEAGFSFWAALYIPIVVAMAAQQNVVAALRGGSVAVSAALATTIACGACIALMNRLHHEVDEAVINVDLADSVLTAAEVAHQP